MMQLHMSGCYFHIIASHLQRRKLLLLTTKQLLGVMKKEEYTAPSLETIVLSTYDNYCGLVISPGSGSGGGREPGMVA